MNIKIKLGNFRFTCDNLNPERLLRLYEKAPQILANYYMEIGGAYLKYVTDLMGGGIHGTPDKDIIPVNGHDIYNYVARYGNASYQVQMVLRLDGQLDFKKLREAVMLSVEAEPVLGCRFVEGEIPYWKKISKVNETCFCSMENTENPGEAIKKFLNSSLDMDKDPMVKVRLIRTDQKDIVCIKINHACCDGTGAKEYIHLLAGIYSNIIQNDGIFIPIPGRRGRIDQDRLFNELGIKDPDSAWVPGSDITNPTWNFPWKHGSSSSTSIEVLRLPDNMLEGMKAYARGKDATINDLILTAYYRAMLAMGQPEYGTPMEIPITIDLRRYLPDKKTEAIRNFSGSVATRLSMVENEPFIDTLSRVTMMMHEIKGGTPGLQSAIGLERLEKISFWETLAYYQVTSQYIKKTSQCTPYTGNKCVPTLSNLGYLSNDPIKLGELTVTDACIIPPAVRAPGFLLVVGTYNEVITLTGAYYEGAASGKDIRKLMGKIRDELAEGCEMQRKA